MYVSNVILTTPIPTFPWEGEGVCLEGADFGGVYVAERAMRWFRILELSGGYSLNTITASTSTSTPLGNAETATTARAGYGSVK